MLDSLSTDAKVGGSGAAWPVLDVLRQSRGLSLCNPGSGTGFRSLLRFFRLACQQQPKKEFK